MSASPYIKFNSFLDVFTDDDANSSGGDHTSSSMSSSRSSSCQSPVASSSRTSLDWDARSVSPAPSVYSMTSSLREQSYRYAFGRSLNNYSDVYHLPADSAELQRLDKQHEMYKVIMGKYPPPLYQVLADDDSGVIKSCLDLGCGSGSWILDLAHDFPHVSCVAVDLVPMQIQQIPPNLRCEVDDVNLGLEHFYGAFDMVHVRFISSGIRDFYRLIDDSSRILKPGGLFEVTEFDFRVYDHDHNLITPSFSDIWGPHHAGDRTSGVGTESKKPLGQPWLPRWLTAAQQAMRRRGGNVDAAALLNRWVSEHKSFTDVVYREFWLPASPWMTPKDQKTPITPELEQTIRLAQSVSEDMQEFLKSGRPLLLGSGIPEDIVNELEDNTRQEILEARQPLFLKVQSVYARKKM